LGGTRTIRSDARLIAATNRNLKEMIDDQKFRSDLYYRLSVFPIYLPPLRERAEDIPALVRHFVQYFSERNNRIIETVRSGTMEALVRYHWPGNIRELQNVIERAVIISKDPTLTVPLDELTPCARLKPNQRNETLGEMLNETERTQILRALEHSNWVVSGPNGAATLLGIKRTTLASRMQKLGISMLRNPAPQNRPLPSSTSSLDARVLEWPISKASHANSEPEIWRPSFA
jgi:formate hydrogenlyase transcriptional activator